MGQDLKMESGLKMYKDVSPMFFLERFQLFDSFKDFTIETCNFLKREKAWLRGRLQILFLMLNKFPEIN